MIVNLIEENLKNIYKKDFLNQNSIYFNNNLSKLDLNSFTIDNEIIKLKEYLPFIEKINIFISLSMMDFLSLVYIIDYFNNLNYQGVIEIDYLSNLNRRYLKNIILNNNEYKDFSVLKLSFFTNCNYQGILDNKLINLKNSIKLLEASIKNPTMFEILVNNALNENSNDIELTILYLLEKYPEYGFSKNFYQNYLSKKE